MLAGAACVAWRELLAPLLVPMGPEALALLVERHYSQLDDRLISAVQFAFPQKAAGFSRAMIERAAAEAQEIVRSLDFRSVIERRGMVRMLIFAACTLGLLGGFWAWQSDLMGLWFQRNVLFADVPWPQKTYLEVRGGPDFAVLRGEDLPIVVTVREGSEAPSHVTLHRLFPDAARPTEERIDKLGGTPVTYFKTIRSVNKPFGFYVTGGDDETDKLTPHKVSVIDRPVLTEAIFTVEYPKYTNLEPRRIDGTKEMLAVPYGGRLRVEATASKELTSAEIYFDGRKVWPDGPEAAPAPGDASRKLLAQFALPCENRLASKDLKFVLKDLESERIMGRQKDRPGAVQVFSVQVLPDDPPAVQIAKVGGLPDFYKVTPVARTPLRITVRDRYGIGLLQLTDSHDSLIAEAEKELALSAEQIRQQYRLPAMKVVVSGDPQRQAPSTGQPVTKLVENRIYTRLDQTHTLSLKGRVRPGQTVRISAEAQDGRTKQFDGPGVGQSDYLAFEVVEIEIMQGKLLGRQKRAAEDFAVAVQLQATAYAKTDTAAGSDELKAGKVPGWVGGGLRESARGQDAVGDACGQAASVFQGILEESKYNGVGDANEHNAISLAIVRPLRALVSRCGEASAELRRISAEIERGAEVAGGKLAARIAAAGAEQMAILEEMKTVARRMEKLRSLQAMADKVRRMIRWVEQLLKEIEQQRDAGVEGIFEPKGAGKQPPGAEK
jgi:hypothetical protein